jgi:hypothetical protein
MSYLKEFMKFSALFCIVIGVIIQSATVAEAHIINNPWVRSSLTDEELEDSAFINAEERFVDATPFIYDYVWTFSEGFAPVLLNGRAGVVNKDGDIVVPLRYNWISPFSDGLALAETSEGVLVFICDTGEEVINIDYDVAELFTDGLAPVMRDDKWGFINKEGNEALPLIYDGVKNFCDGLAPVAIGALWGFIDTDGNEVFAPQFEDALCFCDDYAWVMLGGRWGVIDKDGENIIPYKYLEVFHFVEGLAAVMSADNERWGYIDKKGNEVVPFIYEAVFNFNEGLAPVLMNEKWGFIGFAGNLIIPFEFNNVSNVSAGVITIEDNGIFNVISKDGHILLTGYDIILGFNEGMAPAVIEGKWGFVKDTAYAADKFAQNYEAQSVLSDKENDDAFWVRIISFISGVIVAGIAGGGFMIIRKRVTKKKKRN